MPVKASVGFKQTCLYSVKKLQTFLKAPDFLDGKGISDFCQAIQQALCLKQIETFINKSLVVTC